MEPDKKKTSFAKMEQSYSLTDMNGRWNWGHYSYMNTNGKTNSSRIFSYLDMNSKSGKSMKYSLLCMNGAREDY
ncbi:MAG: hypothetical protein K1V96_04685 [Lachnospiraceae bacterium]